MNNQNNTAIVKSMFDALLTAGDWKGFVTDDVQWIVGSANSSLSYNAVPWIGRVFQGKDEVQGFLQQLFSENNFEVLGFDFNDYVEQNNIVVVFGVFKYKARTTGKIVESDFAVKVTLENSKIKKYFFYENTFAVVESFKKDGDWTLERDGKVVKI
jgi:ketosteroid isomerase-like protein